MAGAGSAFSRNQKGHDAGHSATRETLRRLGFGALDPSRRNIATHAGATPAVRGVSHAVSKESPLACLSASGSQVGRDYKGGNGLQKPGFSPCITLDHDITESSGLWSCVQTSGTALAAAFDGDVRFPG